MALKNDFVDADSMATAHAAHHNALATYANTVGPGYLVGRYYDQRITLGAATTGSLFANMGYYFPIYMPRPLNIDRIGINVTTIAGAGGTARLGLTAITSSGVPSTTLFDWGTVATDALASQQITISSTLPAGWSYFALATSSHTAPDVTMASTANGVPLFIGTTTIASTASGAGIRTATTGAAIPAPLATHGSYTAISNIAALPLIFFRPA